MGGAEREHAAHGAEQLLEHVAPVREHVADDPAAVRGAVVPRRPLRRRVGAGEDPVAELAADRQDAPERAAVEDPLEGPEPRQEELVLHDAVPDAGLLGEPGQLERRLEVLGDRLLAVDVPAGLDRRAHRRLAAAGDLGVEVDLVGGVGERRGQVGGERQPVRLGQRAQLALVTADEQRVRPQDAVDAALLRIARIERRRCWFVPMRPVTPFMTIPTAGAPAGRRRSSRGESVCHERAD